MRDRAIYSGNICALNEDFSEVYFVSSLSSVQPKDAVNLSSSFLVHLVMRYFTSQPQQDLPIMNHTLNEPSLMELMAPLSLCAVVHPLFQAQRSPSPDKPSAEPALALFHRPAPETVALAAEAM